MKKNKWMLMLLMAAVMIVAAACGNAKESGKTDINAFFFFSKDI